MITFVINLRWDAFVGVILSRFGTGILALLSLSNYFIIYIESTGSLMHLPRCSLTVWRLQEEEAMGITSKITNQSCFGHILCAISMLCTHLLTFLVTMGLYVVVVIVVVVTIPYSC